MNNFLDWYFGINYLAIYTLLVLFIAIAIHFIILSRKKKKGAKIKKLTPGIIIVGSICLFNYFSIVYLNPTYWGYGTPSWFNRIQITEKHILLFDNLTAYVEQTSGSTHDEFIPNLRVHVVDKNKHKKLYSYLIGDYYYTREFGKHLLLVEHSTYSRDDGIGSIDYFDPHKGKTVNLATKGEKMKIGDETITVHDIKESPTLTIRTDDGRTFELDQEELKFVPTPEKRRNTYVKPNFNILGVIQGSEKKLLYAKDSLTELSFLDGKVVNEHEFHGKLYALVHSFQKLDRQGPFLTAVDENGNVLWTKDVPVLQKDAGYDGVNVIHRTIFSDSVVYVTIGPVLIEYDIISGKKNWALKL